MAIFPNPPGELPILGKGAGRMTGVALLYVFETANTCCVVTHRITHPLGKVKSSGRCYKPLSYGVNNMFAVVSASDNMPSSRKHVLLSSCTACARLHGSWRPIAGCHKPTVNVRARARKMSGWRRTTAAHSSTMARRFPDSDTILYESLRPKTTDICAARSAGSSPPSRPIARAHFRPLHNSAGEIVNAKTS